MWASTLWRDVSGNSEKASQWPHAAQPLSPISTFPQISLLITWRGLDAQRGHCPGCCRGRRVSDHIRGPWEEAQSVALFGNDCTERGRTGGKSQEQAFMVEPAAWTPSGKPATVRDPDRLTANTSTTTTEEHTQWSAGLLTPRGPAGLKSWGLPLASRIRSHSVGGKERPCWLRCVLSALGCLPGLPRPHRSSRKRLSALESSPRLSRLPPPGAALVPGTLSSGQPSPSLSHGPA